MGGIQRFLKREDGQAVVEAAITMPIFLFLLCGIIELSYMFIVQAMVDYAAYCAARTGIVRNGDPDMMKWAAAGALAPVTQTSFPVPFVTLRASADDPAGVALLHLTHWGSMMIARAQFEDKLPSKLKYGSKKEYLADVGFLGGMSQLFLEKGAALSALGGISAKNVTPRMDANGKGIQKPVFTINDLRVLDPDDFNRTPGSNNVQGTSAGHTYMSLREYWSGGAGTNGMKEPHSYLLAREPRANEYGTDTAAAPGTPYEWDQFLGDGIRLTNPSADVQKKLRLRVEIIHSHKLLFKFLVPMVNILPMPKSSYYKYWSTGIDPGVRSKMSNDERFRNLAGRVILRGEWTMRMQSNYMKPPLPTRKKKGRQPQ